MVFTKPHHKNDTIMGSTFSGFMMPPAGTRASAVLPSWYRAVLTTIEPISTFIGGLYVLTTRAQAQYISAYTRDAVAYDPATRFLYTQMVGPWLALAFNGGVMLRLVDDLRLWRLYCVGMLLSDAVFAHGCAQAVGGWSTWLKVWEWGAADWALLASALPLTVVRVLVLANVGVKKEDGSAKTKTRTKTKDAKRV